MSDEVDVALVGAHSTRAAAQVVDRSLEEMVFEAATGALADAGLGIDDIDGVVLATADQSSGRVIESMVTNGAAGGVGRDVTTLASGGEHALIYAHLRLRARQGERLLVLAWSKASEVRDPRHVQRVAAEPFLLRPLGVDATVAAGLQASSYVARHGLDADALATVRAARERSAARIDDDVRNESDSRTGAPVAWPLTDRDFPRPVDMACGVVLVAGGAVTPAHTPAWVHGTGWSTDRYELAERDLSRFEALEVAARRAGCAGESTDGTVFEVQEISTVGGFAAYEALGLCAPGRGAEIATGSDPVVNPSGGNLARHPGNAAGFIRFLWAAQQVRGRAGGAQVEPRPSRAVGASLHGFAGQGAAVMVFGSSHSPVDREVA